jgi:hypothetical protein
VETWVVDPDGARWEWYVKTGDADQADYEVAGDGETQNAMCCASDTPAEVGAGSPCG